MDKRSTFVYVTYIASTPEKVWNALTDGELTKEYWVRHRNTSDWQVGSRWEHQDYDDANLVDIAGTVVESEPPRRLVVTWAVPAELDNEAKRSRVTYEIKPFLDVVRLTLTHAELEPGSAMEKGITAGWPVVLASLKTFLETGRPFESTTRRWEGPPPA